MIKTTCYCGAIEYHIFTSATKKNDNIMFIKALGLLNDTHRKLTKYNTKESLFTEYGFCNHCGASVYKIDQAGQVYYALHREIEPSYEYGGILNLGF